MAGIAAGLGVSEPAIYYHFPSKQALLLELGAHLLGTLQLPPSNLDWEPWLEEFAHEVLAFARSHRLLHDLDLGLVITAQSTSVRLLDQILGQLVQCGFTLESAALACGAVLAVVQPFAAMQAKATGVTSDDHAMRHDIAVVAHAPLAAALYADPRSLNVEENLAGLLRVVLSGIRVELAPKAVARGRRGRA